MMGRQGDRSRRPAAAQKIENEQGMDPAIKPKDMASIAYPFHQYTTS